MRIYELIPNDSHKSFYGKAKVMEHTSTGTRVLYSYDTPVLVEHADGTYSRLWNGWSATTGKHIRTFCGMSKKEYLKLPLCRKMR